MTRVSRKISQSGYYHIMVRGIDKQIIFEDDNDRTKFLNCLRHTLKKYDVKLIAYCLMINHVHLLICDKKNEISRFMQTVNSSYASYFNIKYKRIGPLFHDRYKSETIEDERRLLAAYRYILNNPYKVGLGSALSYPWNSYVYYNGDNSFVDVSYLADLIGDKEDHIRFLNSYMEENFIDWAPSKYDDAEANQIIKKILNVDTGFEINTYKRFSRDKSIVKLRKIGLTTKQIQRLTGISKNIIYKAWSNRSRIVY